jgi:adenylate cyclase
LEPDNPCICYNIACLFSIQKKVDDAFIYLKKAIKEKNHINTAKTDSELDNIRDDPRFKKLIGE